MNALSGAITSPSYPDIYPANTECVWVVRVHRGRAIKIKIVTLALGRSIVGSCLPTLSDSLAIYKGEAVDAQRMVNIYCTAEVRCCLIFANTIIVLSAPALRARCC
jgi:hypothetical protein